MTVEAAIYIYIYIHTTFFLEMPNLSSVLDL